MDFKYLVTKVAVGTGAFALAWLAWKRCGEKKLSPWKGSYRALQRADLPTDGRELFSLWLKEAEKEDGFSARVMAVATCTPEEGPTVRSVTFHTMKENGSIVFGTNSKSQKAQALLSDPRCELLFRWGDRQIRIRGRAELGNSIESDTAFARLPRHCQLGLRCLSQGKPISEPEHQQSILVFAKQKETYGADVCGGLSIPRPDNYTAVVVHPTTFEFYQGGQQGYINDRFIFGKSHKDFTLITRLQA